MSTDHEDLDPMSEQEIAAVAALDRRGRAAGAAVMTAVARETLEPADVDLIRLPQRGPSRGRGRGRTWLLVAAVVVLLAAVAGAALVLGPKEQPPSVSNGRPDSLVPRWLPDGFEPAVAATSDSLGRYADSAPVDGRVVVYGLASAPDPWADATVTVARLDTSWDPDTATGDPVTIAGHPGVLETTGNVESVAWDGDGASYYVVGQGVRLEQVLAAAEGAGPEPSLDPATLPPGFEVIAEGPASAAPGFPSTPNVLGPDALLLTYLPDGATDQTRLVGFIQRPGDAADVDLARLWADEARPADVRGGHAVVGSNQAGDEPRERFVQWWEPSGLLMTAVGRGLSEEELLHVVAELAPAEDSEIEHLLANYGVDNQVLREDGGDDVAESIVSTDVATGDRAGTAWSLSATSSDDGTVSLDLQIGDETESLTWDEANGPGDMRLSPQVVVSGQSEVAVFAASDGLVARATIDHLGTSPTEMAMYPVALDGQSFTGFIGFVPIEDDTVITVTSYDAGGREVERAEISPRDPASA
jgi:hypothetical protein